ncbi:MAG: hypothetical protein KGO96_06865 [Elusimicrobia bacterium]|nr:hypothetical protein [Elusimicrobiota bacterium]
MAFPSSPFRHTQIARQLADKLTLRLSSLGVAQSNDSNGNPVLTIGSSSWATGHQYLVIRVVMVASIQVDVLGLSQTVYTPETIQIFVEGNTAGTGSPQPSTSDFNSVLSFANELAVMGEVLRYGTRVEVWDSGSGVQPAAGSGTLKASFDDLINPLTATA